jgi:hypothetical protein
LEKALCYLPPFEPSYESGNTNDDNYHDDRECLELKRQLDIKYLCQILLDVSIDLETFFDHIPVNIGEKRLNVFRSFSGLIVE